MNRGAFNNADAMHRRDQNLDHPLARTLGRAPLTRSGRAYVAMASDPFSDSPVEVVGMPDQTSGKSYVLDVRRELAITKPAALAAGNWDAHVAFVPVVFDNTVEGAEVKDANGEIHTGIGASGLLAFAPVQVCSVLEGDATFDPANLLAYEGIAIPELLDPNLRCRVIGGGFEVHDVTAEINKQGSVTIYRVDAETSSSTFGSTGMTLIRAGIQGTAPPSSIASAKQINGVTHESKDGALVVIALDDVDPRAKLPSRGIAVLTSDVTPGASGPKCYVNSPASLSVTGNPVYRELPYMQSGAYFTGLADSASLKVTVRLFIEVFPSPGDALMAIAKLAPSADPAAMEMLSILQSSTLPGYPVSWNSFGFFTRALKDAANAVIGTAKKAGKAGIRLIHDADTAIGGAQKALRAEKNGNATKNKKK